MPAKDREKAAAAAADQPTPTAVAPLLPTYGFPPAAFDVRRLPDADHVFISDEDVAAFETALQAPDHHSAAAAAAQHQQLLAHQQGRSGSQDAAGLRSPKSPGSFSITRRDSQSLASGLGADDDDDDDAEGNDTGNGDRKNGGHDSSAMAAAAAAAVANGDFYSGGGASLAEDHGTFVTAQNDWAPISSRFYHPSKKKTMSAATGTTSTAATPHPSKKRRSRRRNRTVEGLLGTRSKDETRDGYLYLLAKWPLLLFVLAWLLVLGILYLLTRFYIVVYEQFFTWRGKREGLRRELRKATSYEAWVRAARELDAFLGRKTWREENDFAYYDSKTVKRVWDQMRKTRANAEADEKDATKKRDSDGIRAVQELKALTEACVKNNFVGIDNPKLYSQTYYGTKNLVQNFIDEGKFYIYRGDDAKTDC